MANILVCDDERSICEMLDIALRRDGHRVETVQSGQAAKKKIDGALYDVIVTDIKMPNIDGIEVLRHAHRICWRSKFSASRTSPCAAMPLLVTRSTTSLAPAAPWTS